MGPGGGFRPDSVTGAILASRHGMNLTNFLSWLSSCYRVDKSSSCGRRIKHLKRAVCQSRHRGEQEHTSAAVILLAQKIAREAVDTAFKD
jgi:hypothetical protein